MQKLKELIDADVFRIAMKQPYSKEYDKCMDESKRDLFENARPKLIEAPPSMAGYDTLILAYPNS